MKREIRKIVRFTPEEWKKVCKRAEALKMKKCTFLRNISMCREWRIFRKERIAYPMKMIGNAGGNLAQLIEVARARNYNHLDDLLKLQERYHTCRLKLMNYYSEVVSTE